MIQILSQHLEEVETDRASRCLLTFYCLKLIMLMVTLHRENVTNLQRNLKSSLGPSGTGQVRNYAVTIKTQIAFFV